MRASELAGVVANRRVFGRLGWDRQKDRRFAAGPRPSLARSRVLKLRFALTEPDSPGFAY
jgi:hypothetical protein